MSVIDVDRKERIESPASFFGNFKTRPLTTFASVVLFIMLALQLIGLVKVDGYAIALLVLAIFPWASWRSIIDRIAETLEKLHIKSIQLGSLKTDLERTIEKQNQILDRQRDLIDDLIAYSMAYYIYDKLMYLYYGTIDPNGRYKEYKYPNDEPSDHDFRYLRDHGYIEMFQFGELKQGENLVGKLKVTEMGRKFIQLKERIDRAGA